MTRFFRKKSHDVVLKHRTEGTSNEISMSVLDATKEALDEESTGLGAQKPAGRTPLGFIRLFTLRGRRRQVTTPTKDKEILLSEDLDGEGEAISKPSASEAKLGKHARPVSGEAAEAPAPTTWVAPREEITSRKSHRRRGRLITGILGSAAVVALVAVGVWAAVTYFGHQETLRTELDEGLAAVDRADEPLMDLDELVAQQASLGASTPDVSAAGVGTFESANLSSTPSFDALEPSLENAQSLLRQARGEIEYYKEEMGDARDYEVANEAIAAIDSRLTMIETGTQIMETALPLREAQYKAAECWKALMEGDAAAREAATLITDTTQDHARASIERSQAALTAFERSRDLCSEAASLAPTIDLAPYAAYINLRIEAQQAAIAADNAYLNRDKELAASENDRYNTLDAQAVEAARQLNGSPADLIGTTLVDAIKADVDSYGAARQQAGSADGLLRTYLERR